MEASALSLVPKHESYLRKMEALSRAIIVDVDVGADDHFGFIAVHFHAKQLDHSKAMLLLGGHPDAMLVARTMLEGLAFLKWCHHDPAIRALRWRMFTLVRSWRAASSAVQQGDASRVTEMNDLSSQIGVHGDLLLSSKALKARSNKASLPADPYIRNWYDTRISDVFAAVKGSALYEGAYDFASEWIHWSPDGLVSSIAITNDSLQYSSSSPVVRVSALGEAFRAVAETSITLAKHFNLERASELEDLWNTYLDELGSDP